MQKNRLELIIKERKKQGITWEELSDGLPIAGNSLRVAFTRKSVDEVYIEHVESKLNIKQNKQNIQHVKNEDDQENDIYYEKDGVKISLDEILLFVSKNEERCMQEKIFSNIVEVRVAKRISEITASKEKLMQYLDIS